MICVLVDVWSLYFLGAYISLIVMHEQDAHCTYLQTVIMRCGLKGFRIVTASSIDAVSVYQFMYSTDAFRL